MPKRKPKRGRPPGPKIDKRRSTVTDADIVAELARNGGNIEKCEATLKIRKGRANAVNRKYGGIAELKKRESALAAVENVVITTGAVMETFRKGDGDDMKAFAIGLGVAADKYLLFDKQPNQRTHATQEATTTTQTVDLNDILDRLSRGEADLLLMLRDKLRGIDPPPEQSDLNNPEVYSDDDTAPEEPHQ